MEMTDREFGLLKVYLLRESGIDVAEEKRYLFTTRLSALLQREGFTTYSDFHRMLVSGKRKDLIHQVIELMTTHESGFFRDEHPYQVLTDDILPEVSRRRTSQARFLPPKLRILSAGCSFGQEPYSIALCIQRWLPTQSVFTPQDVAIVGIDISTISIERARTGIFSDLELGRQITPQERGQHFHKRGEKWHLCEEIRKMVAFQQVNLMQPLDSLGKFDVVFCRNVIIYFSREGAKKVLSHVRRVLEPEGVLFIGSAESMYCLSDDFTSQAKGPTTYYRVNKDRAQMSHSDKGNHS